MAAELEAGKGAAGKGMLLPGVAGISMFLLLLAVGYLYVFLKTRFGPAAVQSMFGMVFFLYLIRTEVRDRLR